jgi:hypothetical protein
MDGELKGTLRVCVIRDGMKSHRSYFWKPAEEVFSASLRNPFIYPIAVTTPRPRTPLERFPTRLDNGFEPLSDAA